MELKRRFAVWLATRYLYCARRAFPGLLVVGCSGSADLGTLLGAERCTLVGVYVHILTPTNGCGAEAFAQAHDESEGDTCAFRVHGDFTGRVDCEEGEPTARCEGDVTAGDCSYRMVWILEDGT